MLIQNKLPTKPYVYKAKQTLWLRQGWPAWKRWSPGRGREQEKGGKVFSLLETTRICPPSHGGDHYKSTTAPTLPELDHCHNDMAHCQTKFVRQTSPNPLDRSFLSREAKHPPHPKHIGLKQTKRKMHAKRNHMGMHMMTFVPRLPPKHLLAKTNCAGMPM